LIETNFSKNYERSKHAELNKRNLNSRHTTRCTYCTAVSVHTMKAYRGNWDTAPLILTLGAMWRWVVSIRPRPLATRKNPCPQWKGSWV